MTLLDIKRYFLILNFFYFFFHSYKHSYKRKHKWKPKFHKIWLIENWIKIIKYLLLMHHSRSPRVVFRWFKRRLKFKFKLIFYQQMNLNWKFILIQVWNKKIIQSWVQIKIKQKFTRYQAGIDNLVRIDNSLHKSTQLENCSKSSMNLKIA